LQANRLQDTGAKLMNVALSRAQEGLVIVANLTLLDQKLPSDAVLRGVLDNIQRSARIVDVRNVLALCPIIEDLKKYGNQPELDPESLRTGLFGGRDFAKLCRLDMEEAKESIVVFSAFITEERAAQMGDLFRLKISQGVKVRCITRPPNRNGSIPEVQGRTALTSLQSIGVAIDLRDQIHEKVVLVDGRVAWFGSLNPLSHTSRTSELMARVDNVGISTQIANILSVRRRSAEQLQARDFADAENPSCERCQGWSVLKYGSRGPFFACANACGWTQNIDAPRRNSAKRSAESGAGTAIFESVSFEAGALETERNQGLAAPKKSVGKCPKCHASVLEGKVSFLCEKSEIGKGACKFKVNKLIAQQPIDSAQMVKLLELGRTDLLTNFVSKAGKQFSAFLVMDSLGRITFEFPR
jgi:hypothetical protein